MRLRGKVAGLSFALGMALGCGFDEPGRAIYGSDNTFEDQFGSGLVLSADGQTLAVGAPGDASNASGINGNQADHSFYSAGAVYVFSRVADTWPQQAYVKASNPGPANYFGASIAISSDGSTLVVGATGDSLTATGINGDQTDTSGTGAVYVFVRTGTSWSQQAYIKVSTTDTLVQLEFGKVVALSADGSTLAVGAPGDPASALRPDGFPANTGAVYVFTRAGSTWSQEAYLKGSTTTPGQNFGSAIALSSDGSTLAIGSIHDASNATGINGDPTNGDAYNSGAVFVYARAGGAWSQQAYVKASNTLETNEFGSSVALSADGSLLAVGAPLENSSSKGIDGDQTQNIHDGESSGAVYVFVRDQGTWSQQTYVKASDSRPIIWFGRVVAFAPDGSALFVSTLDDRGGTVYTFKRSGTTWSEKTSLWRPGYGSWGAAIAPSSDASTIAIGTTGQGAYVFLGGLPQR